MGKFIEEIKTGKRAIEEIAYQHAFQYDSEMEFGLANSDEEFMEKGQGVWRNIRKSNGYGEWCFNYALDSYDIDCCVSAMEMLLYNKKYRIIHNIEEIQKNDIITFYDWNGRKFSHFGRVIDIAEKVCIENIVIRSKFGDFGIYEHRLVDTPREYGEGFMVFRNVNN